MALVYCCSLDGLIASVILLICTSLWIKVSAIWLNVNLVIFILFTPPPPHTHTLICKIYLLVLLIFQNSGDANQSVAFKLEQLTSLIYSIEEKVSLFFVYGWQQTWQYSNWKLYCRLTSHLIYRPRMLCLKLWDMTEDTESHLFLLWYLK